MAAVEDLKVLGKVAQHLLVARREEAPRLTMIREYVKNRVIDIYVPKSATVEYKKLVDQSRFNILTLLIASVANNLFIDGYRAGNADNTNSDAWKIWQLNRMDARQAGLFRAALQYGYGYTKVLPGELNGEKSAVITPRSPLQVTTLYRDPINDEWAEYALEVGAPYVQYDGGDMTRVADIAVYDDVNVYRITVPAGATAVQTYGQPQPMVGAFNFDPAKVKVEEHGLGVVPIVRFCADRNDLDDGAEGVIESMIPSQRQLNQTTFGLGMAEQYAAFKQKWVTGMAIPEDENGNPVEPFNAAVNKLFIGEDPDIKFGEFSETPLSQYIDARNATLLHISSVRQIPPHTLVIGPVANIAAEALAALEAGHQQDIAEHKTSLGEDAEQMFRLAGKAAGDDKAWTDTESSVRWRDTTPRSLAQLADAYGKLATLLGVPAQALWARLPDVTDQDLAEWKKLAKEQDTLGKLGELMNGASTPGGRRALAETPTAGGGNRRSGG